ncbi:MAG TPA: excinuclease ABC subunit UvrA [Mobilitalea sp.]|nr:excinuclease ABC subunit UvrA [Mobilitalea sp.]
MNDMIEIKGLHQNNLKNISLSIPKNKIVVFTGVSGSGKSSIVFDTIAAESQRQMNETYTAWVRGRMPKYEKPKVDYIGNLSASVIVDQSRLGGNSRSTVGTISDLYSALRVLYSRIGSPYIGTASYFSFNDPNGMCPTCSGLGNVTDIDTVGLVDPEQSWNEGMVKLPAYGVGNWYWKIYIESELFDLDKKFKDYTEEEKNILYYGAKTPDGECINKKIEGIVNQLRRTVLMRDTSTIKEASVKRLLNLIIQKECPHCHGKRLNDHTLSCKINGKNIYEMCELEFTSLREELIKIEDKRAVTIVHDMVESLDRMIDIGLPYLSMNRESSTLSGGEAQRLKLVRYMGSALSGMTYIFDEPSTGMHPRDVHRMCRLLRSLRDKGNTVLVVEHDKDIIGIADHIIDVGPLAGKNGGEILFEGSYEELLLSGTLTGNAIKEIIPVKNNPRIPVKYLPVKDTNCHNLKNVSVDIPLNVLTVVTGVAGSGKSTLIRDVFAKEYSEDIILVDQSPITATGRSTSATFLGFFDDIRKVISKETNQEASMFSFNSKGGCPTCKGRGIITTELVFMDPVTTVCEECDGNRYNKEALSFQYQGKNVMEILDMSAEEALIFFKEQRKIAKHIRAMVEVGLGYLSLGQPTSTLSGGERQRLKLAKHLDDKGSIFILDEPTTGLHASDIKSIMMLFERFVDKGNTVIIIEHNQDVMKNADYIIDIGPDGGSSGGEIVFQGTVKDMVENSSTITAKYIRKSL